MTGPSALRFPVILLPGIIAPAELRFARLLEALGDDVDAVPKDLEVYGGPTVPPPGFSLDMEIDGITRVADEHGFGRFHLYGHSGGGACALAFTAVYPERVLTLALDEPATDFSPQDLREIKEVFLPMLELPPDQQLPAFLRAQMREGVEPPPPREGPPPPWMADRPAGVAAFVRTLSEADVPVERLKAFDRPVYYSHNSLSNETWDRRAKRLGELFPNMTVELYEGLSHLNSSHAAEPERVAAALRRLWDSQAVAD
ncbi:MAG TPA: alpha/beta hydrolase [Actinomycetota bacterium]|nr:alpha/beta hydrolase [Actinomycetota bacterium]